MLFRSYALGGTVTTGGLSNLYNNTDMQSNPSLSRDGYGIGRLESLAAEGSKAKAADAFYAVGGSVAPNASGLTGGMGLIQNLVESNPELLNLLANIRRQNMGNPKLAMGGPIAFAEGGQKGYLDGPGDGMSDSIPATIEGKQPARLADGDRKSTRLNSSH